MSTKADKQRLALAVDCAGFELISDGGKLGYVATQAEVIAFAKVCEAAGRAQISMALRVVVAKKSATPAVLHAMTIAADIADGLNKQFADEESANDPGSGQSSCHA